jgi:hypothetical protein
VDLNETKERVAVALVETLFRRAGYAVHRVAADRTRRLAPEDLTPSFYVSAGGLFEPPADVPVGVLYRPFVQPYVALENQRRQSSMYALARRQWPGFHLVLVTDHPEPGRSCFQAVVAAGAGAALTTVDLARMPQFPLRPQDTALYEDLLQRIYAMLSADRHRRTRALAG